MSTGRADRRRHHRPRLVDLPSRSLAASHARFRRPLRFAQSFFQVGGNTGQAIGPLLAALIIAPNGQGAVAWFAIVPLVGIGLLVWVGNWYAGHLGERQQVAASPAPLTRNQWIAIAILLVLVFSKNFYMASLQSFYTFYLIERFHLTIQSLAALSLRLHVRGRRRHVLRRTDRRPRRPRRRHLGFDRRRPLPFSLALPFVGFGWTVALTAIIGFVMASSFPAILVYAQELAPGRVGMIAGLFFGFAFGTAASALRCSACSPTTIARFSSTASAPSFRHRRPHGADAEVRTKGV